MSKHPRGIFERPKGSGLWWARYADASGRERREKAGTKGMALKLYTKRKTEAMQGKKLPETLRAKPIIVGELLADAVVYSQQHHHSIGGDNRRSKLLLELFGNLPVDALTPMELERKLSQAAAAREWRPATFNRHKAFLSLAYRLAVANGKAQSNPARLVRQRKEDNGRIRWLSAEEEARLTSAIQDRYAAELPAFLLALHTGMRRSEQYRLTWDCVDFQRTQITIPKTKNGSIRYVPLDDTAVEALLALRDRGNGSGPVMVAAASGHGYAQGHALKTPREWFASACKVAAVPDFSWHCLRHSFASRLVMAGAALRTVQELMGHKTLAMTCRYAHLAPQHQLDAVRLLDGWGKAQPESAGAPTGTPTGTGGLAGVGAGLSDQRQVVVQ